MVGSTSDFYCSICGNRGFCNAWQYTYRCSTHGNKPKVTYYLCANCDPYTNYQTCDVQMSCTACSGTGNITVQNDCANCVGTGTIKTSNNCTHGKGPGASHYYCSSHGNSVYQYH